MSTEQRVAVVTGGYGGIGLAICRGLAKQGLSVVLAGRNPNQGNASADDLQKEGFHNVVYAPLDVTIADDIRRLGEFVDHKFGRLDVLVNNAGIYPDNA
jgi:NAD(P)-dependent dehydrogenase (short-subunit alcohol dehydrogenase family)